jgi:hypothetical protein
MSETRYIEEYENCKLIRKIPYTVPDEQVENENHGRDFLDFKQLARQALTNWATLTAAQKDAVLKNLLKYVLWHEGVL